MGYNNTFLIFNPIYVEIFNRVFYFFKKSFRNPFNYEFRKKISIKNYY